MKLPLVVLSSLAVSCAAKNINTGFHHVTFNVSRGDSFEESSPYSKPRLITRDTPDGTILTEIENQSTFYSVELEIGSNKEKVIVLIDTGSSDLWVSGSENPYCKPGTAVAASSKFRKLDDADAFNEVFGAALESDKFREILKDKTVGDYLIQKRDAFRNTDDSEAIAAILDTKDSDSNALSSGTVKKASNIQSSSSSIATMDCSTYGVFDHESSSSFTSNSTDFFILYGDSTYAAGEWGYDNVNVGGLEVKDLSFAVANQSNSSMGVLGIGLKGLETTNTGSLVGDNPYTYDNLPAKLVADGLIHKNVYSLWLNSGDASTGSVLFGGIDHNKYEGELQLIPVINTLSNYYKDPIRLEVTLSSITIGGRTVTAQSYPALLDSGTTLTYLPSSIVSAIASEIGAKYSSSYGYYLLDCPSSSNTDNITYSFQGIDINVPLTDVVLEADNSGSVCALAMMQSSDGIILGDSFLRSAYVVYDLDEFQIGLAQAVFNNDNEDIEVITSTIPGAVSATSYSATYSGSEDSDSLDLGTGVGSASAFNPSRTTSATRTSTRTSTSRTASASATDGSSQRNSANVVHISSSMAGLAVALLGVVSLSVFV